MVHGDERDLSTFGIERAERSQGGNALLARRDARFTLLLKFLMMIWPLGILGGVGAFFFQDEPPLTGYVVVGSLLGLELLYFSCYRLTIAGRHELARLLLFSCWTVFSAMQMQLFSADLEGTMLGTLFLGITNLFYAVIIIGVAALDVWFRARRWIMLILCSHIFSSVMVFWVHQEAMVSPRHLAIMNAVCFILLLCVVAFTRAFVTDLQELLLASEEARERESALRLQTESARDTAMQASLIKSQFLANMSHELRTPLTAIIGYVDLIEEEADEMEVHDFDPDLDKIKTAAMHLHGLINDILDLSKIEAGKLEIVETDVLLPELLEGVHATIKPLILKNENRFHFEDTSGIEYTRCDDVRLRQILLNLLSNAAKFTLQGDITLRVSRGDEQRQLVCFEVEDSGIGIAAEKLDRIFAPFEQADGSTTREYGGTGLGLPITARLVEMMGGEMEVESKLDEGSTFRVLLPLSAASAAAPTR